MEEQGQARFPLSALAKDGGQTLLGLDDELGLGQRRGVHGVS
jgi:hypothetical protein